MEENEVKLAYKDINNKACELIDEIANNSEIEQKDKYQAWKKAIDEFIKETLPDASFTDDLFLETFEQAVGKRVVFRFEDIKDLLGHHIMREDEECTNEKLLEALLNHVDDGSIDEFKIRLVENEQEKELEENNDDIEKENQENDDNKEEGNQEEEKQENENLDDNNNNDKDEIEEEIKEDDENTKEENQENKNLDDNNNNDEDKTEEGIKEDNQETEE